MPQVQAALGIEYLAAKLITARAAVINAQKAAILFSFV
jgi:hypothetical protein